MSGTDSLSYNLDQLEEFRVQAGKAAGHAGTLGDTAAQLHVAASDFGTSDGGAAVAAAAQWVVRSAGAEFAAGERLLRDVARAMDAVMAAIENADRTGAQDFSGGASHLGGGATAPASAGGGGGGGGGGGSTGGGTSAAASEGTAPPVQPGSGVTVNLPDGLGSVQAPNAKAAGAVREALSQLGVPYVWGGEAVGKGFDCSGLTQWAYGTQGISLQHFAAAQDVGERVSEANLAPGDLVVWSGHVAMYVGHGQMIEAPHTGAVVHLTPLRTTNAGDAFEGFFRPSG